MPVLDTDLLTQMEYMLLETQPGNTPSVGAGAALFSTMWSYSDWVTFLINRQNEFLRKTGIVVLHSGFKGSVPYGYGAYGVGPYATGNSGIGITPHQEAVPLPQGTIEVLRVAFQTLSGSLGVIAIDEQPRDDAWSLDAFTLVQTGDWEYDANTPPSAYTESVAPPQQIYWANPPANSGNLDLLAINVAATLTGLGVPMTVPDDFTPYPMYGSMADLLNKTGEGYWPQGAAYCESRFSEGVQLAKMMLRMSA